MNILKVMQNVIEYQDLDHKKFEAFIGELICLMVKKYGPLVELSSNPLNPRVLCFNLFDHPVLFQIKFIVDSPILNNPIVGAFCGNNIEIKLVAELKNVITDLDNSSNIWKKILENPEVLNSTGSIKIKCRANSIYAIKKFNYYIEDILNNPWEERKKLEQEIEDQIKIISEQLEQFRNNLIAL